MGLPFMVLVLLQYVAFSWYKVDSDVDILLVNLFLVEVIVITGMIMRCILIKISLVCRA